MNQTNQHKTLEQIISQLIEKFDHIAGIYVEHPNLSYSDSVLHISIFTGDIEEYHEYLDMPSSGKVTVEAVTEESVTFSASVAATIDGPGGIQRTSGTIIHMADSVLGAQPRSVETGLSMVRHKVAGQCPHCGAAPDDLKEHYRNNTDCIEAEEI